MNFFLIQFNLPLQKQNLRHQGTQKVIELWTDSKQTGDSDLVQSKGTKMICINSIKVGNIS